MTDTSRGLEVELDLRAPGALAIPGPAAGATGLLWTRRGWLLGWTASVAPASAGTLSTPLANPAAGADLLYTVPAGTTQALTDVAATLTTSAAVANRQVVLQVRDAAGNIVIQAPASAAQAAGAAVVYLWGTDIPDTGLVAGVVSTSLPPVTLGAGWTVRTVTANLQAGDQWSAVDVATTGPSGATLTLFDGRDATGLPIASVGGLAGATDSDSWSPGGIILDRGLFAGANTAVTLTAVYIVPAGHRNTWRGHP